MARQSTRKGRNVSKKIGKQNRKHSKKHAKKNLKHRKTYKHRGGGKNYEVKLNELCILSGSKDAERSCSDDAHRKKYNVLFVMIGENFDETQWTNIKKLLDVIIGQLYFLVSKLTNGWHNIPDDILKSAKKKSQRADLTSEKLLKIKDLIPQYISKQGNNFELENNWKMNKNIFNKIVFIFKNGQIPLPINEWLSQHERLIDQNYTNCEEFLPKIEKVEHKNNEFFYLRNNTSWSWPIAVRAFGQKAWESNNYFICGKNDMIQGYLIDNDENSMIKTLKRRRQLRDYVPGLGVKYNIYILTEYLDRQLTEEAGLQNRNVHKLKIKDIDDLSKLLDRDIEKIRKGPGASIFDAVDNMEKLNKDMNDYALLKELQSKINEPIEVCKQYLEENNYNVDAAFNAWEKKADEEALKLEEEQENVQQKENAAKQSATQRIRAFVNRQFKKKKSLKDLNNELRTTYTKIFNELSNELSKSNANIDIITIFFIKLYDIEREEKQRISERTQDKIFTVNLNGEQFQINSFYAKPVFSSTEERELVKKTTEQEMIEENKNGQCEYITYKKFLDAGSHLELLEGQANRILFKSLIHD